MSTLLPLLEPEQQRRDDIWAYISPSRLNTWLSCPLKFRLKYIDRIPQPSNLNLFLGKQVHSGLETYYRHRQLGITLTAESVSARMLAEWDQAVETEQMTFAAIAEESALRNQAAQLVTAYLQQVPADEPHPLAVEVTMEMPLVDPWTGEDLGIPLLGIVDLMLNDVPGPTIVDFKTTSKASPPFAVTHEVQLSCYSYLFRAATGLEEAGLEIRSLVKTKQPKIETQRYEARTEQHQRRLFAIIREYINALDAGRYNFRPSWACSMCDYREHQCQAWQGQSDR